MSEASVSVGCIFHWTEYTFSDGEKADKYFVMVGVRAGCNYLAVIATSKQRKRKFDPGCHPEEGYYHIPGGKKDWFPKDTWLLIAEPIEIKPSEFLKRVITDKAIALKGNLRQYIANAIRNCLKRCPDVSELHLSLL